MLDNSFFLSILAPSGSIDANHYAREGKFKGDSNPNDKYILSEKALWTMNFYTSIIKISWKMGKLWAFKEFNMANI